MSKWMLRQAAVDVNELAAQWGIHPVLAHVLAVRGFRQKQEVEDFLQARSLRLPSALAFADMQQALNIVSDAVAAKKRIAIFGDYDADGIVSTVILYQTLSALQADVMYYIPQRESEGYGLNNEAILALKQQQVELLITCDNGISAFEQVLYANSLGLTVVVLDHHDIPLTPAGEQTLIPAAAVVDAKRQDCQYPFKLYCAAGLCYRFSEALYQHLGLDWQILSEKLLPLAALATICDLVDLTGDNRSLVQRGLPAIANSTNCGLVALRKAVGLDGMDAHDINAYHVGFRLGPCVNASGRLEDAALAVELFLTEDERRAVELAAYLVELNDTRKILTEEGAAMALGLIERQKLQQDKIILVHCPGINESVAGIVAGKIKEQYHKPIIVVAGDKDVVRGSARSIEAYNVFAGLSRHPELFINFGGHPMAAGFSMEIGNVPLLRQLLNQECALTEEEMQPIRRIDKVLSLREVSLELAKELQALEPYGKGNPPTCFADKGVKLQKIALIGQNKQVLRLYLQSPGAVSAVEAVCFNGKEKLRQLLAEYGEECWGKLLAGHPSEIYLDILYTVNVNTYQQRQSAQMQVTDFRLAIIAYGRGE